MSRLMPHSTNSILIVSLQSSSKFTTTFLHFLPIDDFAIFSRLSAFIYLFLLPSSKRGSKLYASEKDVVLSFGIYHPFTLHLTLQFILYKWSSINFMCMCTHMHVFTCVTQRIHQRTISTLSSTLSITGLQYKGKFNKCCWTTDGCNNILIIRIKT